MTNFLYRVSATRLVRSYDGDMFVDRVVKFFMLEEDAISYGKAFSKGSKGCTYHVTPIEY